MPSLGGVPAPLPPTPPPLRAAAAPVPATAATAEYCLCVLDGGRWRRVVTVGGIDQAEAYVQAVASLPEEVRDKPVSFRASEMCPPRWPPPPRSC